MADQFCLRFRLPRKLQGSFTCRKSATWDRRLCFPSEGKRAVDFFAQPPANLTKYQTWGVLHWFKGTLRAYIKQEADNPKGPHRWSNSLRNAGCCANHLIMCGVV
jgi:hypothetical protein